MAQQIGLVIRSPWGHHASISHEDSLVSHAGSAMSVIGSAVLLTEAAPGLAADLSVHGDTRPLLESPHGYVRFS